MSKLEEDEAKAALVGLPGQSKLDEIFEGRFTTLKEEKFVKQEVKDLMLELIGENPSEHVDTMLSRNELRQKVEEL